MPSGEDATKFYLLRHHAEQTGNTEKLVESLVSSGLIDITKKIISAPTGNFFGTMLYGKIESLMSMISFCSNNSTEMCRELAEKKFHRDLIERVRSLEIDVAKLNRRPNSVSKECDFINSCFIIMFNTIRNVPGCKQDFRKDGVIEYSLKFLDASDSLMRANALLLLAFAADISSDVEVIKATSSNIEFIINDLLWPAIRSPNHNSEGREDNKTSMACDVEEILETLSLLSKNKENAEEIAKLGMLKACETLFEQKLTNEKETSFALSILWSLTFHEGPRKCFESRKPLLQQIEDLKNKYDKNQGILQCASGIDWNLKKQIMPAVATNSQLHVMISYCHKQQSLAWSIWNKLKEKKIDVWIDTVYMEGDIFGKMAEGVQNASHVICCVSEDYFNSDACRSEAQYAKQLKKHMIFVKVEADYQPKDWLGIIMAGFFYYEIYNEDAIEKKVEQIAALIQKREIPVDETVPVGTKTAPLKNDSNNKLQSYRKPKIDWSTKQVKEWFNSIGCQPNEKFLEFLMGLNGELLSELIVWRTSAPEFFLKFMKDEFGFAALDLVKLSNAMEKLAL